MLQILSTALSKLSPLATIASLVAVLVIYIVIKVHILPYLQMRYYKRQGAATRFHWSGIPHLKNQDNAISGKGFYTDYRELMEKDSRTSFVVENFGSRVQLICVEPQVIKELLTRIEDFKKDTELLELLKDLTRGVNGFNKDDSWKKDRRLLSTAFHYDILKTVIPITIATSKEKFEEWKNSKNASKLDIYVESAHLTGEITGRFFFGKRFSHREVYGTSITTAIQSSLNETILENFTLSSLLFGVKSARLNILPRHREMNARIQAIRNEVGVMIEESRKDGTSENTFLNVLLELSEAEKPEDRMNTEQLTGQFIGVFLAGTDTTSHLVGSAIYFLARNPTILEKVKEEVYKELKDLDTVNIENVGRMEYTNAVIKETLRLGGVTGTLLTRIAEVDTQLGDINVKKGTLINFVHDTFYSSEKYFTRAKEFIPERWLDNSEFNNDLGRKEPYAFLPFSAGQRNCIGQHLAMIEAKLILGVFVKTFDFSVPDDYEFKLTQRFVFQPIDPVIVTLKPK